MILSGELQFLRFRFPPSHTSRLRSVLAVFGPGAHLHPARALRKTHLLFVRAGQPQKFRVSNSVLELISSQVSRETWSCLQQVFSRFLGLLPRAPFRVCARHPGEAAITGMPPRVSVFGFSRPSGASAVPLPRGPLLFDFHSSLNVVGE